jgi:hypothetical protein
MAFIKREDYPLNKELITLNITFIILYMIFNKLFVLILVLIMLPSFHLYNKISKFWWP